MNSFSITKPTLRDIPAMRNLILPEVQSGIILDRSEDEMATSIRSYSVVRENFGANHNGDLSVNRATNLNGDSSNFGANPSTNRDSSANGKIIAFAALHIHSMKLAEVRSLIVAESHRRLGIATALISQLIAEAQVLKVQEILTLTYKKEVFSKMGFREIAKDSLPNQKIWADCIKCKKFPICDEVALLKTL